ncbi:hypothetical protein EHO60_08745 [Leptospira fletcheri]|uniref:NHL repeat containing protein n=2 Tax=Leptospira fletcheri TaxID=2484981 RepID=A0A4R9GIN9_9LEPT|nr:hypothetical protein EHO60_08745 [Leptospira fletcheri]
MSHGSGFLLSIVLGNLSGSGGSTGGASCTAANLALGETSTVVLGQTNFTSSGFGSGLNQLHNPQGMTHDSAGGLWVSDTQNNRMLHFPAGATTNGTADLSIGGAFGTALNQFNNPQAIAMDFAGGFWVADYLNHRVLHFPSGVVSNGNADIVIGTTGTSGLSTTLLNSPRGVTVDSSGGIWVVDTGNNRLLHFSAPLTSGKPADIVLGQSSFTVGSTTTAAAATLANPNSVTADSNGGIWVSDAGYHRVLHYSSPFSNGKSADLVLGQFNFGTSSPAASQTGLWTPTGLSMDAAGGLWVADYGNRRAVHYSPLFFNGQSADHVLGEPDYVTNNPNLTVSAQQLLGPNALTVSPCGQLWVADYSASRVLYYP